MERPPGAGALRSGLSPIVDLMRRLGGQLRQWVWHVNWDDVPEVRWNRLENYYPGETYCPG